VKKLIFWVAAIFLLPVSYGRTPLALAGFLVTFHESGGDESQVW